MHVHLSRVTQNAAAYLRLTGFPLYMECSGWASVLIVAVVFPINFHVCVHTPIKQIYSRKPTRLIFHWGAVKMFVPCLKHDDIRQVAALKAAERDAPDQGISTKVRTFQLLPWIFMHRATVQLAQPREQNDSQNRYGYGGGRGCSPVDVAQHRTLA